MIYLKYSAVAAFMLAMFSEFIGFVWMGQLYRATKNMQQVKHKLLKQILLRFTNCGRLNIRICNTPSFVRRYISNYSVAGLHYRTFEKLGVLCAITGLVLTTWGTVIYADAFYRYALLSMLSSVIYLLFCHLFNTDQMLAQCTTAITDYLDNTLNHRILVTETAPVQRSSEEPAVPQNDKELSDKTKFSEKYNNSNSDEIIFSVINDFLV